MMMKSFRFTYALICITAIGGILSFSISRGEKTEVDYYDFAEIVTYDHIRDHMSDISRYCGIGLDKEAKTEIKNIMDDFDLGGVTDNLFDGDAPGQIISTYNIIVPIKDETYILEVKDFGIPEKNLFWLRKIYSIDKRFYYTNDEEISTFRNGQLSKRLSEFIQKNKNIIDGKMSNIKQEQPKYTSPMIQRIHEFYYDVEAWAEGLYYRFVDP